MGPWSEAGLLFTGEPGWQDNFDYAAFTHPEFAKFDGRVQYVTYVRTTGLLRQEIPLAEIVFRKTLRLTGGAWHRAAGGLYG